MSKKIAMKPSDREAGNANARYKMDLLQTATEGKGNGVKTAILNIKDVAFDVHRPPA
jgi:hypothetical protein